jgi:flagellin
MLSLHTNSAALSTQNSLAATQQSLNTSLTRLGSGYRVNSAMDDAAGLQIATRLESQTQGMTQAQSNTANGISMLQTADGGLAEASNILLRMKDLATEAATASSSSADDTAMQSEYDALGTELNQIVTSTTFGGANLFSDGTTTDGSGGSMSSALTFQIGDQSADTMTVDTSTALTQLATDFAAVSAQYTTPSTTAGTELTTSIANSSTMIDTISTAISDLGALRSQIGAGANRLTDVSANLTNMITNTTAAQGQIMDVDYAKETSKSSSDQLLMQAGTAALKQANSMSQLVVSLLQQ